MRVLAIVFAALLAFAAAHEKEEGVLVGTDANLKQILSENEHVLVEFYAPWCGHCKSLAPEYAKAAQQLAEEGSAVALVKVDATVHSAVAEEFDVNGYPTLKFFHAGVAQDYTGGRLATEIVAWLKKKSGPPAVPVADAAAVQALAAANDVVVVGVFADPASAEAVAFVAAAARGQLTFAVTADAAAAAAVGAAYAVAAPAVFALQKFDDGRVDFPAGADLASADAVATFAHAHALPVVIDFSEESAPRIFGGDIKSHVILFARAAAAETSALKAHLRAVGTRHRGAFLFIFIDADVDNHLRILEFFGLNADALPAVRAIKLGDDMVKYAPPAGAAISEEALAAFVQSIVDGTARPHLMAQETPADWDALPVKVLTGNNFDAVARDPAKHVLVEFYAPWCGHCKQLAPIYDELAEAYLPHSNIVIAKMDSTLNELADVRVQGFPTIKLFPAGENAQPIDFEGQRDLAGFAAFLKEHTGVEIPAAAAAAAAEGDDQHDEL